LQISSLPITPIQRQSPRQDSADRELRSSGDDELAADISQSGFSAETNANSEQLTQRPVESSTQSSEVFSRSFSDIDTDGLSLNSRRALQTFSENTPSAQQQLGIELVGVDTYA
jgi:hypothetical protein